MSEQATKVAILGNPNVGKSTLFNALTGAAQVIGNWCGKTTEACTMAVDYQGKLIHFTDLPGIYGFGRHSREETTVDSFLQATPPDIVVVVVDAMSLERNLYLVLEVLERYGRALVVLNKMDAAQSQGIEIDRALLAELLKAPVIPAVATGDLQTEHFFTAIFSAIANPSRASYHIPYPPAIERAIDQETPSGATPEAARWSALRSIADLSDDNQVDIINARYARAAEIASRCVKNTADTESLSDRIDSWALHRYAGVPIMLAVFGLLFYLTFSVSRPASDLISEIFVSLGQLIHITFPEWGVPTAITSMLADGLINGVGATLGFLPQIAIFFLVYNFIQDSGYIVRVAFLMDRIMSAIGLNGKIFIPLVAGYSCNVNGILASRILTSRYDRLVAVLASSFAPCSARLGVMVFMVSAFFPSFQATIVMLSLLGISVSMMAVIAFLVRFFVPQDEASAFITEVPPYHLPDGFRLLKSTATRTLHFLKRIRNVIIISSLALWYLSNFPAGPLEQTYLARIGQTIEPVGAVMGLNWQLIVALIVGIPAKESALTALGVIYHATEEGSLAPVLASQISPLAGFTFLVVYMTYIPCLATVITIYQELRNWSVAVLSVYGNILLSILLGLAAYNIGKILL